MISDLFFENNDTVEKSSKFRFITIGGLTPVKNQLLLVRVFSRFIKTYSIDVELYIVGEGPLYTTIKKEIHALGLEKTVFLINALNRKDIKKEIQKSHVGVISSIVETFSIAGIEYMSQGLPVITTNCGGPNEYMRDFNGIIVHNEKEMAASFYSVYKNYSTYDADKISRYIQTCFSEAVIVQKLERTYQELVQFNKG
jgi:glycosyltransferase involved in cell wall biosynthesis